ncbi:MAG: HAD family phosphatase [Thermodesulfovibrionia bacterium]|nr:HAD family phosphatase [Thermodesulfovibrionia bacterium]
MRTLKAVIFDFGGVMADEGFREGLKTIGIKNRLDPENFFKTAEELIYQTGYIAGASDESTFWNTLREKTGISESDKELREEILKRFAVRTKMINLVKKLKSSGLITAILSDQTNWLDEINQRTPFFHHFDYIFNSFNLKKSKKDQSIFRNVCSAIGFKPEEVLFVDDNIENTKRALSAGLKVVHFKNMDDFEREIKNYSS